VGQAVGCRVSLILRQPVWNGILCAMSNDAAAIWDSSSALLPLCRHISDRAGDVMDEILGSSSSMNSFVGP
jgi:hypothetical protein